jgi:hypothetical protein
MESIKFLNDEFSSPKDSLILGCEQLIGGWQWEQRFYRIFAACNFPDENNFS